MNSTQLTQAVKLNSVFMDEICDMSAEDLYQEALAQDIPFYRWHEWLDVEMTRRFLCKANR